MARIRTLKPEFPRDGRVGRWPVFDRYFYAMLIVTAPDDYGAFAYQVDTIKGSIFPYDRDISSGDITEALRRLYREGRIFFYRASAEVYVQLVNWDRHQVVKNPSLVQRCPESARAERLSLRQVADLYGEPTESLRSDDGDAPETLSASRASKSPEPGARSPEPGGGGGRAGAPEPPPSRPSGSEEGRPAEPVVANLATTRAEPSSGCPPIDTADETGDRGAYGRHMTRTDEHRAAGMALLTAINDAWAGSYSWATIGERYLLPIARTYPEADWRAVVAFAAKPVNWERGEKPTIPLVFTAVQFETWRERAKAAKLAGKAPPPERLTRPLSEWHETDLLQFHPEGWFEELIRRRGPLATWENRDLRRSEHPDALAEVKRRYADAEKAAA